MYVNLPGFRFVVAAILLAASSLRAQEIDIRLSIKYILDAGNNRAPGWYDTEANIIDVIDETNFAMQRLGRGYRFVIVGNIESVYESQTPLVNSSSFFDLDLDDESGALEDAAEADPAGFHWSDDAVNIYIVNCCGGGAAIPSNPGEGDYRIVFVSSDVNYTAQDPDRNSQEIIWLHELGHHFNLHHTWEDDGVADTRTDVNPSQCTFQFGCVNGGSKECCCSTKVSNLQTRANNQGWTQQEFEDIRYNVMSYYGAADCPGLGEDLITIDNLRLTDGQLDRFTDATRRYHSNEVTGLTYFVDRQNTTAPFTGYSTDPYTTIQAGINAAIADRGRIVNIRSGAYPENLLISAPITLRASRGPVTIGQ